ncbi:MAG: DUF262 domain-containing protein [Acidimicrobiia bacterium]
MSETKFGFSSVGIAHALSSRRLAVPIHQRSYAWGSDDPKERDQVQEFWDDLSAAFDQGDETEYFLGAVVVSREGSADSQRATIIDGQQRIATTAILLAAIRDVFKRQGDTTRADSIQQKFLASTDLATASFLPQLTLNADDDPFFGQFIIEGDISTPSQIESHDLIARAYNLLLGYVGSAVGGSSVPWETKLTRWVKYLEDRARIIVVDVPTEADAFLIFETLNDRGADLTIADLLKNFLFRRSEAKLDVVRGAWTSALAYLDISAAGSQLFTDFLRHFWSSKYGATRERELYARIKDRVTASSHAVDLALELKQASRLYAAILHSDHDYWSDFPPEVKTNIDVLSRLNLEQHRPLLLAAMQHLTKQELKSALKGLVAWSVRGLIVGGIGGGTAERLYCDAAMKVRAGDVKTAGDIASELSSIVYGDSEFRERFEQARVTRGTVARYILAALERTERGEDEPELVPNENETEVNLEHILPRNPSKSDWPQFTEEQWRSHLHRIGNLALLSKGPNGRIGNKPFSVKKPILVESAMRLTQDAGSEDDWTPESVVARQKRLAELAVRTWPV